MTYWFKSNNPFDLSLDARDPSMKYGMPLILELNSTILSPNGR